MADNTRLPVGTADGDTYASDDIAGIKIQRVKIVLGADGSNDGDASSTNPVPVSDNGGSLTVDGPVTDTQLRASAVPISVASIPSHAVTNAGTFAVQAAAAEADGANVTLGAKADAKSTATDTTPITAMSVLKQISASVQAPPSQAVTNAGTFAVQAAAAEADGANVTLGAKADAKSTATDTTPITAMSVLKQISASVQAPPSQAVTGPLTDTQLRAAEVPVSVASIPSHAVTNAGTFAVQATIASGATTIAKTEDAAAADGDVGVPALALRKVSPDNCSTADGDYEFLQMSAGRLFTSSTIDNARQISEPTLLNTITTQYSAIMQHESSSAGSYGFELR